jgi:hypothetical protein
VCAISRDGWLQLLQTLQAIPAGASAELVVLKVVRPAAAQMERKKSSYRGVSWFGATSSWRASIKVESKAARGYYHVLGIYDKEEDAARTFDAAARQVFLSQYMHTLAMEDTHRIHRT